MVKKQDKYPAHLLEPVKNFLNSQLEYFDSRKKAIEKEDPYLVLGQHSSTKDQEQFQHDKSVAITEQLARKISQTELALSRIISGDYGFCLDCSKMINTDRLAIYPEATSCITCQKTQETE